MDGLFSNNFKEKKSEKIQEKRQGPESFTDYSTTDVLCVGKIKTTS